MPIKRVVRIVLPCGCHSVTDDGKLWTKQEQFHQRGLQGIQVRIGSMWHRVKGVTRKRSGYIQVTIHGRVVRLNRLIAHNFIPNPLSYPEVQHKNGIKTDNRVVNLKWGNQQHNADDRARHGQTCRGQASPNAKLTDKKVRAIRRKHEEGASYKSLADMYSVSKRLIILVCQRRIWRHVI